MGYISQHFKREEFSCKCGCGYDTVDYALLTALEDVRAYFGKPITITSGCRCKAHNEAEGGSKDSQHLYGKAADFVVAGIWEGDVVSYLKEKYPDKYGIGEYIGRTHLDVRDSKARWDKR